MYIIVVFFNYICAYAPYKLVLNKSEKHAFKSAKKNERDIVGILEKIVKMHLISFPFVLGGGGGVLLF